MCLPHQPLILSCTTGDCLVQAFNLWLHKSDFWRRNNLCSVIYYTQCSSVNILCTNMVYCIKENLCAEKDCYTCMLSTNPPCFLYLCQSTFGNINWEEPHGILNRVKGIYPIIQLSNHTKHPSRLTTSSNFALWHQPKTLCLSNHWLYIYLNLFQDQK